MDLSQFCQSAIPWPKVFSPKVIIRDGQGCHDSLSQNPVLPSQHETEVCNDPNQDSPVLLDLSQSAKYEYHCVSHADCSSSTNRKQCNICLPNEHSCISCRKDSQHDFLGTSCQSPKEVQTSKKMFSRSQDQHHNSNSSRQDFRDEADPYSRHESVLGTPDWSTLGSLMPDWKVSCSGAMVPPGSEYHVSYPKDLRMPALSWCSQHKPSLSTGRPSPVTDTAVLDLHHSVCRCSTKATVSKSCLHHQPRSSDGNVQTFADHQCCCQTTTCKSDNCDCRSSEKSHQETRCVQMFETFTKKEPTVSTSDSVSCHPQCPCIFLSNDDECNSRKKEINYNHSPMANDESLTGKSQDYFQSISYKVEMVSSAAYGKPDDDLDSVEHIAFLRQNILPSTALRSEVQKNHPHAACTESYPAEPIPHGLIYHGVWTVTKSRPANAESLLNVATLEKDIGSDFILNNTDYTYNSPGHQRETYGEHCHSNAHGNSSYQFNLSPQTAHTSSQWRKERNHSQAEDRISNRHSPNVHAQGVFDNDEPYDLSMKSVKNINEHHVIKDNTEASFSTTQHTSWSPHETQSVCTRVGSLGKTQSNEPTVYSPVRMLPYRSCPFQPSRTPGDPESQHQSSDHRDANTARVSLSKPIPELSVTDSLESSSLGCQRYRQDHDVQQSSHNHVCRLEPEQSDKRMKAWNSVSHMQLVNIRCNSESLSDKPTKGLLSDLVPSSTVASIPSSTVTSRFGHGRKCVENFQVPTPTHITDTVSTSPTEQSSHNQTLSTATMTMTGSVSQYFFISGEAEKVDSLPSTALSPTINDQVPQTQIQNTKPEKPLPLHRKMSVSTASHPSCVKVPAVKNDVSKQHVRPNSRKKRPRQRNFQCHLCSVTCSNRGQLTGHLRTHTGERPFMCEEPGCSKTFVRNEELTRHRRIHSGERPYACSHCGKSFMRKDHLNKHMRMHV